MLSNLQMKDRFLFITHLEIWVPGEHNASYNICRICYQFKGFSFLADAFSWNQAKLVPEAWECMVSVYVFLTSRISEGIDN